MYVYVLLLLSSLVHNLHFQEVQAETPDPRVYEFYVEALQAQYVKQKQVEPYIQYASVIKCPLTQAIYRWEANYLNEEVMSITPAVLYGVRARFDAFFNHVYCEDVENSFLKWVEFHDMSMVGHLNELCGLEAHFAPLRRINSGDQPLLTRFFGIERRSFSAYICNLMHFRSKVHSLTNAMQITDPAYLEVRRMDAQLVERLDYFTSYHRDLLHRVYESIQTTLQTWKSHHRTWTADELSSLMSNVHLKNNQMR